MATVCASSPTVAWAAGPSPVGPVGSISGIVTNGSNQRLAGICVYALGIPTKGGTGLGNTGSAKTNASGRYTIGGVAALGSAGVPTGAYTVEFFDSCGTARLYTPRYHSMTPSATPAPVVVRPGQVTTGIGTSLVPVPASLTQVRFRWKAGDPERIYQGGVGIYSLTNGQVEWYTRDGCKLLGETVDWSNGQSIHLPPQISLGAGEIGASVTLIEVDASCPHHPVS
jgi:hypothetical protein